MIKAGFVSSGFGFVFFFTSVSRHLTQIGHSINICWVKEVMGETPRIESLTGLGARKNSQR